MAVRRTQPCNILLPGSNGTFRLCKHSVNVEITKKVNFMYARANIFSNGAHQMRWVSRFLASFFIIPFFMLFMAHAGQVANVKYVHDALLAATGYTFEISMFDILDYFCRVATTNPDHYRHTSGDSIYHTTDNIHFFAGI